MLRRQLLAFLPYIIEISLFSALNIRERRLDKVIRCPIQDLASHPGFLDIKNCSNKLVVLAVTERTTMKQALMNVWLLTLAPSFKISCSRVAVCKGEVRVDRNDIGKLVQ